jgi:hypothetical protein
MLLGLHLDQTHINLWLYFCELVPEFRDRRREPSRNATVALGTARSPFPERCALVRRQDLTGWRMSHSFGPARLLELPIRPTGCGLQTRKGKAGGSFRRLFLARATAGPGTPPSEAHENGIIEIHHRSDADCDSRGEKRRRLDGERARGELCRPRRPRNFHEFGKPGLRLH